MTRLAFVPILCSLSLCSIGDGVTFVQKKQIPLAGKGGFDFVNIEPASRRVLVAHSTEIDVVNADGGDRIGTVEGVEGAHGAVIVPELHRGFATAGKKNALVVFDSDTYAPTKEIPTGESPDAVIFVTATKEVWTMNHRAGTITCVDASTLEVTATIEVGGKLECAVEQAATGLVFVNVEDQGVVARIDAKEHTVLARHPLAPAEGPTGLALDPEHGVLFCGCDEVMVVLDASTGEVLARPAIGRGCDSTAYDPGLGLAFASCGDGTTTIVRERTPHAVEVAATLTTAPGARTCSVDPRTHELWLGAGTRGKDDVRLLVFAPAKDVPVPAGAKD